MSRDLRVELRAECSACAADPARDLSALRELLDEHALMPDFDGLADGFLENLGIKMTFERWRQDERAA